MLYDISRTISPHLAVFPGDTPFSARQTMSLEKGDPVNLFALDLTAHCGSHADAVYHYDQTGAHPDSLPLERYLGPARVVSVSTQHGPIRPEDLPLASMEGVARLLIHTWVSEVPDDAWPEDFPYLDPALADWLAAQGVRLLGVDMPSVDDAHSRELPVHHRLRDHDILILETLCLHGVPDGLYELIALPLKLAGVCGSPVRAVLRAV